MIIKTNVLNKTIKENDDNLFLIYGEEDFFIELAVRTIRMKYLEKGFEQMDSIRLDFGGKAVQVDKIVENIELPAWASKKRVVEVINFEFDKDSTEKLPDIIAKIPEGTVLVFVTDKVDKRKKKLYDAFVKNGIVCEVKYLEEAALMGFLTKGFGKQGLSLDTESGESIISRYDSSMRRIETAMKRIAMYCSATDTKNITYEIVDELCEPDVHADIFKITDAVGDGNAASALILLDNLIKLKEPLPRIRFMLARHIRMLICAKELNNKRDIVTRMGVRDFVAKKLMDQARNFNMDKLLMLYNLCYKNDYDLKHGMVDERAGLESFIVLASGR